MKPATYCYLSELMSIGYNSMLILLIKFVNDDSIELKYGIIYVVIFSILMTVSSVARQ